MNPSLCRKGHSSLGTGEVVAAIDMAEGRIVARLNAILYGHIFLPSEAGKVVELLLIYAVGSCANHDACHFGVRQSLIIALLEPLQRCIGVGVGLEVGQILLRSAITPTVELDTLVNLLCDALRGRTVGGCEGRIVAKCATPVRDCAITIRATESRIHRHLLHAMAEHTLEIGRIAIEATRIAPCVYLWLVMFVGFRMLVGLVMLILLGFYHSWGKCVAKSRTLPHTNLEIIIKKLPFRPQILQINTIFESMKLIFATNNAHKLREVAEIVGEKFELLTLRDCGITEDIPEEQPTLEGNALQKARYIYERTGIDCFADDTGLEVDALGGEPGVRSARYATDGHDDEANKRLLLERMEGVESRGAQFRTAVALIIGGKEYLFEGIVRGQITHSELGDGGFGYDPLFVPEGYSKSFAQMSAEQKNAISHRGRAVRALAEFLNSKLAFERE